MDVGQEWQRYKDAWSKGKSPLMDVATFNNLFYQGQVSSEAIEWLGTKHGAAATGTLHPLAVQLSPELVQGLGDSDRFRLWIAVLESTVGYRFEHLFEPERSPLSAELRTRFVADLATGAVRQLGRARARALLVRWWHQEHLWEEEQEALLQAFAWADTLNADVVRQLGPEARVLVHRMVRSGKIAAHWLEVAPGTNPVAGSQPGNSLAPQVGALLQPVAMDLNIVDARLRPDELSAMSVDDGRHQVRAHTTMLSQTLQRLERHLPSPEVQHIAASFAALERQLTISRSDHQASALGFPLLRLLHLRLLLEAPSLSGALQAPEDLLVPAVLSHTLRMDRVTYAPELRVWSETEKRWRARWAESAGEAMSVMFLESAVSLDLTLLCRIPEGSDPTPDFRAGTIHGEPIVFESKGATSWKTHLRQRMDALEQLGKGKGTRRSKRWVQPDNGRAFAATLYAAREGEERKSLLHVVDPPFPFESYFGEGWQDRARREHYAGVLEAARLDGAASEWRQGRGFNPERAPVDLFSIETANKESSMPRFIGTYLPVQELARAMRYPDMASVRALKIFVGMREDVFHDLRVNRIPPSKATADVAGRQVEPAQETIPSSGWLPGIEPGRPARGAYSMLEDGSFLAVELT
jgi:hypothetical protein